MTNKTLQNYRDAFSPTFFTVFKSTMKISILATALCFVIGFPVAYFLVFKVSEKWKGDPAGAGRRAQLHQLPDPHVGVAHPARRQR